MEPPVITTLKQLGWTQHDIAQALHVRDATVSQWVSGKREMAPGVKEDLHELACLALEQVKHGGDPRAALHGWQPTALVTEGGRVDQVVHSGEIVPTPELLQAIMAAGRDLEARDQLLLQAALYQLASFIRPDLTPLTPTEVKALRRVLKGAEIQVKDLLWGWAEHLYPPNPGED
jgi:hypothetical protein